MAVSQSIRYWTLLPIVVVGLVSCALKEPFKQRPPLGVDKVETIEVEMPSTSCSELINLLATVSSSFNAKVVKSCTTIGETRAVAAAWRTEDEICYFIGGCFPASTCIELMFHSDRRADVTCTHGGYGPFTRPAADICGVLLERLRKGPWSGRYVWGHNQPLNETRVE